MIIIITTTTAIITISTISNDNSSKIGHQLKEHLKFTTTAERMPNRWHRTQTETKMLLFSYWKTR